MAFASKNLSVIAYANGFTLWHYAQNAKMSEICASGYFDSVKTLMNAGDIIVVNAADNTAMKKVSATKPNVAVAAL